MPPLRGLLGLDSHLTAWAVDSIMSPPFDAAQGKFSRLAFSWHSTFKCHAGDDLPCGFHRIGQAVDVHGGDQDSTCPSGGEQEAAVLPIAHALCGTGEVQQGEHGEGKLQGEDDLAERQQVGDAAVAAHADDKDGGQDGQSPRDEPAHPGFDSPVHEAFHHDLSGESAGDGAALAAGQQGDGKERAGGGGAQERSEGQVGDANPVAGGGEVDDLAPGGGDALLAEEYRCGEHENRGVDEEGDASGRRWSRCVLKWMARRMEGVSLLQPAALHQRRVQVEVVGHHGRADDADGDVEPCPPGGSAA